MTTRIPWNELNLQQQTEARVTWSDRLEECTYEVDREGEVQARFFPELAEMPPVASFLGILKTGPADEILSGGEEALTESGASPASLRNPTLPGNAARVVSILDSGSSAPPAQNLTSGDSAPMLVPRGHLRPCPFQPRKAFDEEKLNKIALSERNVGIISPIVVRPCESSPEFPVARFEIIAGEQRWRGSDERPHPDRPGETLPALMVVPITVRTNLTDADVLELMLIENMQRADLSAMEESDAFAFAMQQQINGRPRYKNTAEFAEKIGVPHVHVSRRLWLQKLPKEGRKALTQDRSELQNGGLSVAAALQVCACPASIIPLVLDEVLNPKKYDTFRESTAALTAEETAEVIQARYVSELRNAPFDLADPNLVPVHTKDGERVEGGACTDCPWNSALQASDDPQRFARDGRKTRGASKLCLNPRCFKKKVDVHVAAELVRAKEEGCTILREQEAAKVIQHDGSVAPNAGYVRLDAPPDVSDRAKATGAKCPTWGKIVEGETTPPVVVVVDKRGKVHRLVERKLAIAAAQKNKTDHYLSTTGGRGRSVQTDEVEAKRKKDGEAAKLRGKTSRAIMAALTAAIEDQGADPTIWKALLPVAERHAGAAGVRYFETRRAVAGEQAVTIELVSKKLTFSGFVAAVVELLLSQDFAYAENPNSAGVVPDLAKPLLKLYGVDPRKIEAQTKKAAAEKAKKPKKEKAPKLSTEELASLGGMSARLNELRESRGLSYAQVDKIAKAECGRKWCNFKSAADYEMTIAAVSKLPVGAPIAKPVDKSPKKRPILSPEARQRIMDAQKARWAKRDAAPLVGAEGRRGNVGSLRWADARLPN